MIVPWKHQQTISKQAAEIIKEHMIVYLAMEERTGKSLTALLIAEELSVQSVLIITKKKALEGWVELLAQYDTTKDITLINYHMAWKKSAKYDLVILDESHNYISSYPKIGSSSEQLKEQRKKDLPNKNIYDAVGRLCISKPIIYLSATPYAQGPQLLYHQLSISSWSPFKAYTNFYNWFRQFGKPYTIEVRGRQVQQYDRCNSDMIVGCCEHLFITKTRKELDFVHDPVDELHYIDLSEDTKKMYNELMKEKLVFLDEFHEPLICDTMMKLRVSLHMLEGGVAKIDTVENGKIKANYLVLANDEKIQHILSTFNDNPSLVIMYNYKAELTKLQVHFKHAQLLQATSYAEGVDLSGYKDLVIYSQDYSTARHTQRRARQCNKNRDLPIVIHYLLVKKAISHQVYQTVSVNKRNFVDSVFEQEAI